MGRNKLPQFVGAALNFLAVVVVESLLLVGCTSRTPKFQPLLLQSGKLIRVQEIWEQYEINRSPALALQYETDWKISNKMELEREIGEVWDAFRIDVEKRGFTVGMITARERNRGFGPSPPARQFVYEKQKDGTWFCSNCPTAKY
jgi:hypothetical protein